MKSERTLRRHIRELRRFIDAPTSDPLERRIAYESECLLRWVREDVVGWPSPLQSARDAAHLVRMENPGLAPPVAPTKET
jgi:hypothetical protein